MNVLSFGAGLVVGAAFTFWMFGPYFRKHQH